MIDKDALIEFLAKKGREASTEPPNMLVQWAIYSGLIERIKRGDFDKKED